MADDFHVDNGGDLVSRRPRATAYNFEDSFAPFTSAVKSVMEPQAQKIAEHEGKIGGLATAVSALVSFKGFLQAAILGMGALLFAAIVALFTITNSASSRADRGIEELSGKVGTLEAKVDALPGRISDSLRSTSRDLVLISQSARAQPAVDNEPGK